MKDITVNSRQQSKRIVRVPVSFSLFVYFAVCDCQNYIKLYKHVHILYHSSGWIHFIVSDAVCVSLQLRSTKEEKLYHRRLAYLKLYYDWLWSTDGWSDTHIATDYTTSWLNDVLSCDKVHLSLPFIYNRSRSCTLSNVVNDILPCRIVVSKFGGAIKIS